jgi:GAF domain-containing protein
MPRLRSLLRMTREVTARRDLDDVLAQAFLGLRTMVNFSGGSIQLIDEDGWIAIAAADPPVPPDDVDRRIPLGSSVAGRVILTERAVYVPDATAHGRDLVSPAEWTANVGSYLAVPLLVDGRAIGLLRVDDARADAFSESDQLLIAAAAAVIAAAIQNARADARVVAARRRTELLERREREIRDLIAAWRPGESADPGRLAELLMLVEATLTAHGDQVGRQPLPAS